MRKRSDAERLVVLSKLAKAEDAREAEILIEQTVENFVHRLFPSFVEPGFVGCPDQHLTAFLEVVTRAVAARGVVTEVVDLRP